MPGRINEAGAKVRTASYTTAPCPDLYSGFVSLALGRQLTLFEEPIPEESKIPLPSLKKSKEFFAFGKIGGENC